MAWNLPRVRHGASAHSFAREDEVTFGAGPSETPLTPENEDLCRDLLRRLFLSRHADGAHTDPLFRMAPERWLESRLRTALAEMLPELRGDLVYNQVPALSTGDRGMLDLLTLDRNARLVVLELKANEDLHLPLQALDYWMRVRALNADRQAAAGTAEPHSAFTRSGYFPGVEVSALPPRLILAAPALRIHPANEPVLRYLSPEIEWELLGLTEHWRRELKIVFRKRSGDPEPLITDHCLYGFDIMSGTGLPAEKSIGTDTCSCTISHFPSILRYTSVTRTVMSIGVPSAIAPDKCWMLCP